MNLTPKQLVREVVKAVQLDDGKWAVTIDGLDGESILAADALDRKHAFNVRGKVRERLEALLNRDCPHMSRTRYVGCGGRSYWICDECEQVVRRGARDRDWYKGAYA